VGGASTSRGGGEGTGGEGPGGGKLDKCIMHQVHTSLNINMYILISQIIIKLCNFIMSLHVIMIDIMSSYNIINIS
jgi:hypothetical protein